MEGCANTKIPQPREAPPRCPATLNFKIMASATLMLAFLLVVGLVSISKLSSVNTLGGSMYRTRWAAYQATARSPAPTRPAAR